MDWMHDELFDGASLGCHGREYLGTVRVDQGSHLRSALLLLSPPAIRYMAPIAIDGKMRLLIGGGVIVAVIIALPRISRRYDPAPRDPMGFVLTIE
jgi:hypothetical protein